MLIKPLAFIIFLWHSLTWVIKLNIIIIIIEHVTYCAGLVFIQIGSPKVSLISGSLDAISITSQVTKKKIIINVNYRFLKE